MNTVLVVEDDQSLQKFLKELLLDNGYSVQTANDGLDALEQISKTQPDLVVLDLNIPKLSGETVCMEIRKKNQDTPIIILTAKDGIEDKIRGLDIGADDYMTKPFVADEFLARIRARIRSHDGFDSKLRVNDLELDNKSLIVKRNGKVVQLTPQEFKLLHYLMSNKGRILTRDMILNRLWVYAPDIETRVVDVYVGYLRKKIDANFKKKLIHSVRGFGYTIKE